jgi:hypothetical protein
MTSPPNDFLTDDFARLAFYLETPITTADDFLRLASAGEPLRRAIALRGRPSNDAEQQLVAYEAALVAFRGQLPSTLADDAITVAKELATCCVTGDEDEDEDEDGDGSLALLHELDALVSTGVAASAVGVAVSMGVPAGAGAV